MPNTYTHLSLSQALWLKNHREERLERLQNLKAPQMFIDVEHRLIKEITDYVEQLRKQKQ
jgi:hypothetical protein